MFPSNFLWGVATAGYQVEHATAPLPGGSAADWDVFAGTAEIRNRVAQYSRTVLGEADTINYEWAGESVMHQDLDVIKMDLDRAAALGINAYRFSVEWNKVQPTQENRFFFSFYLSLIGEIIARGMKPIISLNHMSLPMWVMTPPTASRALLPFFPALVAAEDNNFNASFRGWESPLTVNAFKDFVEALATAVSRTYPRAEPIWLTLNEPIGPMVGLGYLGAVWSPGFGNDGERAKRVCLNLIRAHVGAYDRIKQVEARNPFRVYYQVSFAHSVVWPVQASNIPWYSSATAASVLIGGAVGALSGAVWGASVGALVGLALGPIGFLLGIIAGAIIGAIIGAITGAVAGAVVGTIIDRAQNVQRVALAQFNYFFNDWFLNAVIKGEIDTSFDLSNRTLLNQQEWNLFHDYIDSRPISRSVDFIGINYYRRSHVMYNPLVSTMLPFVGGTSNNNMQDDAEPHGVLNELGWEVYPEGLRNFLESLNAAYHLPILITENGVAEKLDANRAPNIVAHLREIYETAEFDTTPSSNTPSVMGYVHWSIVDNWEWHEGYHSKARFGIYSIGDRSDPANRIVIGTANTFKRQITEGAIILRNIIENAKVPEAGMRVGFVAPDGGRIIVPSLSHGALWEGSLNGATIKLFLDSTQSRTSNHLTGMIYYQSQNVWIALRDIMWDSVSPVLSFRHDQETVRSIPLVPARQFTNVRLNPVNDVLTGQARESGGPTLLLTANRNILHGVWVNTVAPPGSAGSLMAMGFHGFNDGNVIGKTLLEGYGKRWESFSVAGSGLIYAFYLGEGPNRRQFDVMVGANNGRSLILRQMPGNMQGFGRLPSSLLFLNEPSL